MVREDLRHAGIEPAEGAEVFCNLPVGKLAEVAVERGEGTLTNTGALAVVTGERTGRSPHDRFIVDTPDVHDRIAWGDVNVPFPQDRYDLVKADVCSYLSQRDLFVEQVLSGADRRHARKFEVVCEWASQALFAHQLLVRPTAEELAAYDQPDFMVLAAPGFRCDPDHHGTSSEAAVLINFADHTIIVAGTAYSGEIKKAIFSTMNYLLPVEDAVLPMHCSCNMNPRSRGTTIFFGLSGTGKTTLSADRGRMLVGDDEHGWGDEGVFNLEGGCYAKCIDLSPTGEPQIFNAIRFGAVMENVVVDDDTREPDYADGSLTQNTRVGYPVEFIPDCVDSGIAPIAPDVIIFLTCDSFGVLPPVARLSREAAMYQFITGFTSKVAGTEEGVTEPQPTFSSLFGEPFMPLDPMVYADMLGERIERGHTRVYLVNTGWTGGPYGQGQRMSLRATRRLVRAAMSGRIDFGGYWHDERFNLDVPRACIGVPRGLLNPRTTWKDPAAYDAAAERLAALFEENARTRHPGMEEAVAAAGPHPLAPAGE